MRRILLFIVAMLTVVAVNAQNLPTLIHNDVDVTNTTIVVDSIGENIEIVKIQFKVANQGSEPMIVTVNKEIIEEVEGTQNFFCFGQCVGPATMTFTLDEPIEGQSFVAFDGDYMPMGLEGTTTVKYSFTTNLTDEECSLTVKYHFAPSAINDLKAKLDIELYPNPVATTANLDFDIPKNISNAKVIVYSLTGAKIKEYKAYEGENNIMINAVDYKTGVYIISVVGDNRIYGTRKLVVM